MARAQAGTLRLSTDYGVRITSETVIEHKDEWGRVVFRELAGFEVRELWPGALQGVTVSYLEEPSNATELTGRGSEAPEGPR